MNNKQNNNWQIKQELAEYLYGLSHTDLAPLTNSPVIMPEQKKIDPVKLNGKPVKSTIQWGKKS